MASEDCYARKLSAGQLKRLSEKGLMPWVKDAAIDWAVIVATFIAVGAGGSLWLVLPALLVIGNRQHALTVLGHEGAHFALSKSRKLNDQISNLLAFWPLGLTTSGYRAVHMKHHKHTNSKDDPEVAHRAARAPQWDLPISAGRLLKYCAGDLCGGSVSDYMIIVTFSKAGSRAEYVPPALVHFSFIAILLIPGLWWVPVLWYVSLVTSFMMFFRLRTVLEHLGTANTHRLHLSWWQRHLLAPHNIWYHWEHHSYPAVSYHKLPEVRRLLPAVPVMRAAGLMKFLRSAPKTRSGQILKDAAI